MGMNGSISRFSVATQPSLRKRGYASIEAKGVKQDAGERDKRRNADMGLSFIDLLIE